MIISTLLDFFTPESCIECQEEGRIWCDGCRLSHGALPSRCFSCHKQTNNFKTCSTCKKKTGLKAVYIYGEYEGVNKELIKKFKFNSKRHCFLPIADAINENMPYFPPCSITFVPVPSSSSRVRQRGFDHTVLLARRLAKLNNQNFQEVLVRMNDIRQVGATRVVRQKQIKGAFRANNKVKKIKGRVMLVDDVITTGATLSEATKTLKKAGVKQVDVATFVYSK